MFETIPLIAFMGVMFYISIHDCKYRSIPYFTVPILFIIAPIYIWLSGVSFTIASLCFLYVFMSFALLFIVGRGGFGIGDVIVVALAGWIIADFDGLYTYLLYLFAPTMFLWFLGNLIVYWKRHGFDMKGFFKFRKIVNVKDLKPGMVMANDNFMHGLTEKDIEDLKKRFCQVSIKEPMAFVPVVFISILIYFILHYSELV